MDLSEALAAFQELERGRYLDDNEDDGSEWNPPLFTVRLDAYESHQDDERMYRLFVRLGKGSHYENDEYREILKVADEHGMRATIENNGIELA